LERLNTNDERYAKTSGYGWDGIMVHRFVPTLRGFDALSYALLAGKYVRKLEREYGFDVIHAHSIYGGFLAYYKPKAPTVFTAHGFTSEILKDLRMDSSFLRASLPDKVRTLIGGRIYSVFEEVARRRSSVLIALRPSQKRYMMERFGVNEDKIFVIPNGVDVDELEEIVKNSKIDADFEKP
jgi:glycosyltransferase involved in cell wall biosynthesis